jgi:hypothetical protein
MFFHESVWTAILAAAASSDPYEPTKRRTYGQLAALAKASEA